MSFVNLCNLAEIHCTRVHTCKVQKVSCHSDTQQYMSTHSLFFCCSKPDLSHQCVTYMRTMHTHAHKHSSAVEVIFCFSVLNPSPVSPSLQYPLLFALQSPPRLLCYHPSMSLILSPDPSLPSSLPFPLIKKSLCPPSFMF